MVTKAKGARGRADKLFSEIVRWHGVCEAIGQDWHPTCAGRLETSHMISRRYSHTRTDFRNALCLCSSAHRYVGADPGAHYELVAALHGAEHWLVLRRIAARRDTKDWEREAFELKALAAAVKL